MPPQQYMFFPEVRPKFYQLFAPGFQQIQLKKERVTYFIFKNHQFPALHHSPRSTNFQDNTSKSNTSFLLHPSTTLAVDLIFYLRSKDVSGFLDEKEVGTNKACPQQTVNTQSTMEKKVRKRWARTVRKKAGGSAGLGGPRAAALPTQHGPRGHCPSHLRTLGSDQGRRSVAASPSPQSLARCLAGGSP